MYFILARERLGARQNNMCHQTRFAWIYKTTNAIAKKRADNVVSMLYDFVMNRLPEEVRQLDVCSHVVVLGLSAR